MAAELDSSPFVAPPKTPSSSNDGSGSSNGKKKDKSEKKAALKAEAVKLGMSYEELKKQKKAEKSVKKEKKKRKRKASEAERLAAEAEDVVGGDGHGQEVKRMRSWSKDFDAEEKPQSKRPRTRSMDLAELAKEEGGEGKKEATTKQQQNPDEWRKEHSITLRSHSRNVHLPDLPQPYFSFDDAPFCRNIHKVVEGMGFAAPTSIQSQAWPIAIAGHDMISIAKTGSGKTLGFFLPLLHRLLGSDPTKTSLPLSRARIGARPSILVLAPTRELATQILDECRKFAGPVNCRAVCCYGGANKYPQIQAFERGVECVVATPGRMNDLLEMRKADLGGIKYLVLDEADRMLDMGFEPQIRSIIAKVPSERQTLLFSATWPKEIQRLAHDFLSEPVQINVGEVDALVANKDINQTIVMCREDEKFEKLKEILTDLTKEGGGASVGNGAGGGGGANGSTSTNALGGKMHPKVIVFVAKKISCHELANQLWDDGFAVDSLHGDRQQWERNKIMGAFKEGTLRMLVATDVAARGLDVKDVGCVVNYDMPVGTNAVEDYVHRIGRTGRA
eukprot:CAMPEP_0197446324 /NCGR_PEP_ID=MMETSP1175-20131217/11294_1 /TAXON_ID=1003142 /ORGANISM="Triceratium dubium, Strain CCMP147" /LENGTH=560 /DNA_ID=CAMNT_0042977417 /DNA_START=77 /DNA_END=1756 /DNA_ORIENTATION=+